MNPIGVASVLILMISPAFADNPILHSLDAPFPVRVSTAGGAITSTYTFTNNLSWAFENPFQVTSKLCPLQEPECTATSAELQVTDQCSGKKLQPNETCTYSISLTPNTIGTKSVMLIYGGYDNNTVEVKPALTTTATLSAYNQLLGVDYNPNHYASNYPFNFHDIFFTGTSNNPAATNVYAELQQLQSAGFTSVRSYQTEPYSWIDIINQAHALGMHVIYEAVIPQLPNDINYPGCPLGAQNYIPCAQATLNAVINAVTPAVFNSTVILVFAGHENYCDAGNNTPPCTGSSNIPYLTTAVTALRTTLQGNSLTTPVGSALISGNLITPSVAIAADMQALINSYSADAPLSFDPYPFQWGVSPAAAGVWTPPLSSTVQPINSLAWDYLQVVGSTNPPALPLATIKPFYTPGRVLLAAETGWATAGDTTGYACHSLGTCDPSVASATAYLQALYQLNTNNFVATSGYSIGVLAFEAYDEPAKPAPSAEQNYGLFDANCVQKAAGMVPNNTMVSMTGCQGYTSGTLFTINGTTPPNQASFKVQVSYTPASHPSISVTIPANSGLAPNISTVTPWPQFLIYTGAIITVSNVTNTQSCSTTATSVTAFPPAITFSAVSCTSNLSSMGCFGLGCQLSNPY